MMRGPWALVILAIILQAAAATPEEQPKKEEDTNCSIVELKATAKVIVEGLTSLYCNLKHKRCKDKPELQPTPFLEGYYTKHAREEDVLNGKALQQGLAAELDPEATELKDKLLALKEKCIKRFKRVMANETGKISKSEFVDAFLKILSEKDLCKDVKIYGLVKPAEPVEQKPLMIQPRPVEGTLQEDKPETEAATADQTGEKPKEGDESTPEETGLTVQEKPASDDKLVPSPMPISFMTYNFALLQAPIAEANCSKSELNATKETIEKSFISLYCNEKSWKDGQLESFTFLEEYFDKVAGDKFYLPKKGLRKALAEELPEQAKDLKKDLLDLKPECIEDYRIKISKNMYGRVSRADFVFHFMPLLNDKKVCEGVEVYKYTPKPPKPVDEDKDKQTCTTPHCYVFEIIRRPFSIMGGMLGRGFIYMMRLTLQCTKEELEDTKKTITKGFTVLYCAERLCQPKLEPKDFLRSYFNMHESSIYFLPKEALTYDLVQSLPKEVKKLRKKLMRIRSTCVLAFKRMIANKHHGKIDRQKFIKFFLSPLSKEDVCKDIQEQYKQTNTPKCPAETSSQDSKITDGGGNDSEDSETEEESVTSDELKPEDKPVVVETPASEDTASLSTGNLCDEGNLNKTESVIKEGFQILYCNSKDKKDDLTATKFLKGYFRKATEDGMFLPKTAMRVTLHMALPEGATKAKDALQQLKGPCIKVLDMKISSDVAGKITEEKFVQYFKPGLDDPTCCDNIKIY